MSSICTCITTRTNWTVTPEKTIDAAFSCGHRTQRGSSATTPTLLWSRLPWSQPLQEAVLLCRHSTLNSPSASHPHTGARAQQHDLEAASRALPAHRQVNWWRTGREEAAKKRLVSWDVFRWRLKAEATHWNGTSPILRPSEDLTQQPGAIWSRQKPRHTALVAEETSEIMRSSVTEIEKGKARLNIWEKL